MNIRPQLEDLRLFCVVVRNRSFAETARELGISKAVVSKRIALLEAAVQEKLFHRTTRNVLLTAQGEIVHQWAQRILEDVDLMGEAISLEKAAPGGLLRICSSTGFGRSRLAPALSALPAQPWEWASFKTVRVHIDSHIEFEGHRYSVPHALVGLALELRITAHAVEVLHRGGGWPATCAAPTRGVTRL